MKASPESFDPAFGPGSSSSHHVCQCLLCARERRFHRIAGKLRSPEDRAWMLGFYDYVSIDLEPKLQLLCAIKRKSENP